MSISTEAGGRGEKKTVAVYEREWERIGELARAGESNADTVERLLDEREEALAEITRLQQELEAERAE